MADKILRRSPLGRDETTVVFRSRAGVEMQGSLVRLTRHHVTFEVFGSSIVLQMSEVLDEFRIVVNEQPIYSGRAVISGLVTTTSTVLCEAAMEDEWVNVAVQTDKQPLHRSGYGFDGFIQQWQRFYKIQSEFKVLIADMQTFLTDLRLWVDQLEIGVRSASARESASLERDVLEELSPSVVSSLNTLFEKFEVLAEHVDPEQQPAHHNYVRRQIHPLVLCSPFAYRTYTKPLGYAGDYEMVNMILRDAREGNSMFAKLLNVWFISQPPAEAHRNRIGYLTTKILETTLRVKSRGQKARVFNLGCGPAREVQDFLARHEISNHSEMTLLDFNDDTIAFATRTLNECKQRHHRHTPIHLIKKSVVQVLKAGGKAPQTDKYDLLYCAGLFDYLPDRVCKQLMNLFYEMLSPGGLLVATNVDASNPIRHMLDYVLEWHLIYRNGRQMENLRPDRANPDLTSVQSDLTGVNLYLEVRKPGV